MNLISRIDYYFSWHLLKIRFDNSALNSIIFGTFSLLLTTLFYRYTLILSNFQDKSKLIDLDVLMISSLTFFICAFIRYFAQFVFIHSCPSLIQNHADLDDLLKKTKDTLIDEEEWVEIHPLHVEEWSRRNYNKRVLRWIIGINEIFVIVFYLGGIGFFLQSASQFLRQIVRPFLL